ncbi:MAG TPA: DUF1501 domain-containing protein [Verrucomicrobiales bacterium]|nr:DUF1501 domain-containing protein [Verrucomicrobiales bacterium]
MNASLLRTETGRRQFLAGAAKTFLGVTAAAYLTSRAAAAGAGASVSRQVPTARNVIYLYMTGGMSHLDTWDPKSNPEVAGLTEAIRTTADGVSISDNLPLMARKMDKVALIRSMNSTQGAHEQGQYFMRTSHTLRSSIRHPGLGAWLEKFQDRGNPSLPATVMIGNESRHPGAGFFEARFAPLMLNNPEGGLKNVSRLSRFNEEQFTQRLSLAKKLDRAFEETYDLGRVRAYTDMYDDAVKMMNSGELTAFDLSAEPAALRERYGRGQFGQGCLLARRLVEHGIRFVEVTFGNWDTHNANFTRVPELCGEFDPALSTLIGDLDKRGMLDDTLIVLATEFGRTPVINVNDGRDHHPRAFSCLLAGGGVKGGAVHGASDERGDSVAEAPVSVPDFNATIGYALGLPLDQVLFSPSKRPFTVADKGKPLTHLFA